MENGEHGESGTAGGRRGSCLAPLTDHPPRGGGRSVRAETWTRLEGSGCGDCRNQRTTCPGTAAKVFMSFVPKTENPARPLLDDTRRCAARD
jgi:hypothetical protein